MTINLSVELPHVCPLEMVMEHVAVLESLGFYRVWIPDTVVSPWEAWLVAGMIVNQTKNLKIGLGVTNPYTRHPVVVAQMAATLQQLSNGRLTLSIGKGIAPFLKKAGIIPHDDAVKECISLLRDMTAGKRTSIKGEVFSIDGIRLRTRPPDQDVPLYLAAVGPASWQTAVRCADGVSTFWNENAVENRKLAMIDLKLPTSALVSFSVSPGKFMGNHIGSLDMLRSKIDQMNAADFDEVVIAYRDMTDLEMISQLQ